MEYEPKLPEENNNVSPAHPLKEFFILVVGLVFLIIAIYAILGFLVDVAVRQISPEKETQWFRDSFISTATIEQFAGEGELQTFQFDELDKLKACVGLNTAVELYKHDSDTVNAFAVIGGKIVIFQGLLEKLNSENGLAFVLAHELAHFKNRDHLESMGRGIVLLTITGLASGGNTSLLNMMSSFVDVGQARYSQASESEADKTALHALNCFYGHVGGATEFFESMLTEEVSLLSELNHYFATHPEVKKRIDDIHRRSAIEGFLSGDTVQLD